MNQKVNEVEQRVKNLVDNEDYYNAMYFYGMKCFKGDEVPKNKEKATKLFKLSATGGHTQGSLMYGFMIYQIPKAEDEDKYTINNESITYFQIAANNGEPRAMYMLGLSYYYGIGVKPDKSKAFKYLGDSIVKKQPESIKLISKLIVEKKIIHEKDMIDGYKSAADNGNNLSMYFYALINEVGAGIPPNKDEAVKYYKMAINNNDVNSMVRYAMMLNSSIEKVDTIEMCLLLEKAANTGDIDALDYYIKMGRNEKCPELNKVKLVKYLQMKVDSLMLGLFSSDDIKDFLE